MSKVREKHNIEKLMADSSLFQDNQHSFVVQLNLDAYSAALINILPWFCV